eukprot:552719-Amphidinium_carterae.1
MKLNLWNLIEWDRVIAFDTDMLMRYPLDHVFEMFPKLKIAAVPRSPGHVHVTKRGYFNLNGGFLLVQPDVAMFSQLKDRVPQLKKCGVNVEQPFYDSVQSDLLGHVGMLPSIYNCRYTKQDKGFCRNKIPIHVFHFAGQHKKPWRWREASALVYNEGVRKFRECMQRKTLPRPTSSGNRPAPANLGKAISVASGTCKKAPFYAEVDQWHAMNNIFRHALHCD